MNRTLPGILLAIVAIFLVQPIGRLLSQSTQAPPTVVPGNAPIGSIIAFAGKMNEGFEERTGWMHCDGRVLDNTKPEWTALFEAIGTSWGGDGQTFNVPDLQGLFLRGVDGTAARDPDKLERTAPNPGGHAKNQVGSLQPDAFGDHGHDAASTSEAEPHSHKYRVQEPGETGTAGASGKGIGLAEADTPPKTVRVATTTKVARTGGKETRPKNAYVFWLVRFR